MKIVIIEVKVSQIMLVWNLENVSEEQFLVLKTSFLNTVYSYNSICCRFSDVWLMHIFKMS